MTATFESPAALLSFSPMPSIFPTTGAQLDDRHLIGLGGRAREHRLAEDWFRAELGLGGASSASPTPPSSVPQSAPQPASPPVGRPWSPPSPSPAPAPAPDIAKHAAAVTRARASATRTRGVLDRRTVRWGRAQFSREIAGMAVACQAEDPRALRCAPRSTSFEPDPAGRLGSAPGDVVTRSASR